MDIATLTGAASTTPAKIWGAKSAYSYEEIIDFGNRRYGDDLPPLPLPPMLMLHRVIEMRGDGGKYDQGFAIAEFDVHRNPWFFPCHFVGKPVMPGALGYDGILQLAGFCLVWAGARGEGIALSTGPVKFRGMITPDFSLVQFRVDVKHVKFSSRLSTIKADGVVKCGGKTVYEIEDCVVGVVPKPKV